MNKPSLSLESGEMANLSLWSSLTAPSISPFHSRSFHHEYHIPLPSSSSRDFRLSAAKTGSSSFNPLAEKCQTCRGQGAIECPGCKGTGKNKKNGNIFERWKCFDCQGFGLKSCPACGKGGLTPEQRGER